MNNPLLSIDRLHEMLLQVAAEVVNNTDLLTEADRAIGDGDHGVGMARGFDAVREKLERESFDDIGALLNAVGSTLITSVGGASGIIFGTFFRGAAKELNECQELGTPEFAAFLSDGLQAVKARGGAHPGDKTVIDALEPAVRAVEAAAVEAAAAEASIIDASEAAAEAARGGAEKTKEMIARIGKAKTLGERSLGHPDPGAVSMHLILRTMADFIRSTLQTPNS